MDPQLLLLLVTFALLLVMDVPIAVGLALAATLALQSTGGGAAASVVAQRMTDGVASFPLLAIPSFVLAGLLMATGGMARRLIDLAMALFGHSSRALTYVSTITCMLFGAISGSATAAVSGVGGMLLPEMRRNGYPNPYSVSVITVSATTGLVIPPSNIMIVYAVVAGNVSVAAMFFAGVLPGIVIGLAIMAMSAIATPKLEPTTEAVEPGEQPSLLWAAILALPSLLLVIIVLGGILGGVFSATEAAAIAVLYAFILYLLEAVVASGAAAGLWEVVRTIGSRGLTHSAKAAFRVVVDMLRSRGFRDLIAALPGILLRSGITTAVIFLLIGASQALSWVLSVESIPQMVSAALLSLTDNKYALLLIINLTLLIVGTFMDMTPAVLIFAPIFLPVVTALGIHPVHFGIIMIVNLCMGLCTPPVGTCLFVGCGVGGTKIAELIRPLLPYLLAMFVALMIITYVPALSTWLPRVGGLMD